MRNQAVKYRPQFLLPGILAALLSAFWAVGNASAQQVRLSRISDKEVEIVGGTAKQPWRLRYGTATAPGCKPQFAIAEGNRAWYGFCGWLRLIDTDKGAVIGRWHFGSEIVDLEPNGSKVRVEVQEYRWNNRADIPIPHTLDLDPADPHVPFWPTEQLMLYTVPLAEAQGVWPSVMGAGAARPVSAPAGEAHKLLPELEEAVRRDPLTPWFKIALGAALRGAGDPRAKTAFQEAIDTPSTDYSELFRISTYFDAMREYDLGRAAFERGYADFWRRSNDPRLFEALIDLIVIYPHTLPDLGKPETANGRELIERMYKLMPYGEAAPMAWQVYANYLADHGSANEAQLWRARAEDAAQNARAVWFGALRPGLVEVPLLVAVASLLAAILFAVVTDERYRPQRRLDVAAQRRATGMSRLFGKTQYWPLRDRRAFFFIAFVAWFSLGLGIQYVTGMIRMWTLPVSTASGSFAGPVTLAYLQSKVPDSPERNLLLAFAYQQDGQTEKAAQLYRRLPEFAESWNNLGVILREAGKDQEARAAFERALAVDPRMAEAALNLGRPPADFWTEQHQKYLPGRPMMAPPSAPHWRRALLGRSLITIWVRSLAGPFAGEGDPVTTLKEITTLI